MHKEIAQIYHIRNKPGICQVFLIFFLEINLRSGSFFLGKGKVIRENIMKDEYMIEG